MFKTFATILLVAACSCSTLFAADDFVIDLQPRQVNDARDRIELDFALRRSFLNVIQDGMEKHYGPDKEPGGVYYFEQRKPFGVDGSGRELDIQVANDHGIGTVVAFLEQNTEGRHTFFPLVPNDIATDRYALEKPQTKKTLPIRSWKRGERVVGFAAARDYRKHGGEPLLARRYTFSESEDKSVYPIRVQFTPEKK